MFLASPPRLLLFFTGLIYKKYGFFVYNLNMPMNDNLNNPLYVVIGRIAGIWTLANIGYYLILPPLGFTLSYETSPFAIAIYFLVWVFITVYYFWDVYSKWFSVDTDIWFYVVQSLVAASFFFIAVRLFYLLPRIPGIPVSSYTDLLFASSLYFLPKAVEVLVQQLLISVLVFDLSFKFEKLKSVVLGYALCFGGAHIVLYLMNNQSLPYSITMTTGAFLSSLVFPYLFLRVKGGFVYAYMIHFMFYVVLAVLLHILPPPGFLP